MKTTRILLLFVAALMLIFSSCQDDLVPVQDNDALLLKKGKTERVVPFKGKYTTYPVIINDEGGVLTADIPSEGNATHLGLSTWYSLSTVYANTEPPWEQTGDMVFERKGTGDQLIGYFEGISEPNPPENPFMGSGEYVITEGTGKFEGVTGSGTYYYSVTPDMIGTLVFKGTLTFPKNK